MNKKAVNIVFALLILVAGGIALIYPSSAVNYIINDDGYFIELELLFPQGMINWLEAQPYVIQVFEDTENELTYIQVVEQAWIQAQGNDNVGNLLRAMERNYQDNKDRYEIVPADGKPLPFCMIDEGTGGRVEVYIENGSPRVRGDSRCPTS